MVLHGSLNVPIEHHPTIRYMVYNGYYKVMSNSPKMGQLPTPVLWSPNSWNLLPAPVVGECLSPLVHALKLGVRRWDILKTTRPVPVGFQRKSAPVQMKPAPKSLELHRKLPKNPSWICLTLCYIPKKPSTQWPFQDPELEVPTIFWSLCKGISPQNMAWNMVLTYLHFRILGSWNSHWSTKSLKGWSTGFSSPKSPGVPTLRSRGGISPRPSWRNAQS